MKMRTILITLFLSLTMYASAEMAYKDNPDFQLSKKIVGKWKMDQALSLKLANGKENRFFAMFKTLEFTHDPKVIQLLSEKVKTKISKGVESYYAVGWLKSSKLTAPYILINADGQPMLIVFTDRGNIKYSDPDALVISLGSAVLKKDDLFFVKNPRTSGDLAFTRVSP